ncbi:MAG: NTP transferase domain-containing protein [Candidatus Aenigmarchaeota archaeon]|nr:NTP transferase domain-containing protein [Candidatus Aenigmarchaeota archaeon]
MRIVFLAAGNGERLKPVTDSASKVMIPVANVPFISWAMDSAKKVGEVLVVCREEQEDVKSLGEETVFQKEALGTLNAVLAAKSAISGDFMVINGDCCFSEEDIMAVARTKGNAMGVSPAASVKDFGAVEVKDGRVTSLREKPAEGRGLVNAGIYKFTGDFWGFAGAEKSERGEYEITDAISAMLKERRINAVEVKSWMTLSYPWDILSANERLLKERGSSIAKSAVIMSGVTIEEPVAIGEGARIGPNAYIRKYSSIGRDCHIGNAVEIKNSVVMSGTKIPHMSYIGDSIVGRDCNLAAGFIAANLRLNGQNIGMRVKGEVRDSGRKKLGAVIGNGVKTGVRVSIMPGKKIRSGMAIPAGAIVVRDVEEQPNVSKMGKVI